jgi:hypothetical protein
MLRKLSLAAITTLVLGGAAQAQYPAGATCNISPTQFQSWFANHQIQNGGLVTFANSLGFPQQNTACDFYKWAHQMFLWITSPVGGGILLDSPVFYDVIFTSSGGVYIPNTVGKQTRQLALRGAKPVKFQPGGQAGGNDTLMSINGSIVYFGVHANDVYAWFNTAVTNGVLPANAPFPTSQAELFPILSYAASKGANLPDGPALTIELKTAWIDASKVVGDPASYITISASVPNYIGAIGAQSWTIASPAMVVKTLVLVGMHIVGTVQGHPEMVWSTFEHNKNAPDNTYFVSAALPVPVTIPVPYNSSGLWNFMTNGGSQTGALVPQMTVDGTTGNINATAGNAVRPNNVYRVNPWGSLPVAASAANNTQLVTLNKEIAFLLTNVANKDVRANYTQIGAVWTNDGSVPNSPTDTSHQRGSLLLSNSTMETYHQMVGPNISPALQNGCFGCHNASSSTGTSHLFSTSNQPLVPK